MFLHTHVAGYQPPEAADHPTGFDNNLLGDGPSTEEPFQGGGLKPVVASCGPFLNGKIFFGLFLFQNVKTAKGKRSAADQQHGRHTR